jgi:redox-sensing transcriptional repressor
VKKVPEGVIERLPLYLNGLLQLQAQGRKTVSSKDIGDLTGVNPAEIRRDLIHFGTFGTKGIGYPINHLIRTIRKILGSDHSHQIAIVGGGNLGSAIANHSGWSRHGFVVAAVFDTDPRKIGTVVGGVRVSDVALLREIAGQEEIKIGVLAIPAEGAQLTAEMLVDAGVEIILNYTSTIVQLPARIQVHNSDPITELLYTLHYLTTTEPIA